MSEIIAQQIPYGKYEINILTNNSSAKKMLIFFHGLDGSAKSAKPLFNYFQDYKVVAVEQRGHMNSQIKASRFISKHLRDYLAVIKHFYQQGYKIWILGESMGAAYSTLIAFKEKNMIQGVFAQSIPNRVVDVLKVSKKQSCIIKFMTFISFFTNINYRYQAEIDYAKFSSNKILWRLARLADKSKKRQVRETLATWAANKRAWKYLKKKTPLVPIYYFQPTADITTKMDVVDKVFTTSRQNLFILKVKDAKHILLYEPQFPEIMHYIDKVMQKK